MRRRLLAVVAGAVVCLVPLAGCAHQGAAPVSDPSAPKSGPLWPASDPDAATRAAVGEAYGLFPIIEASGNAGREIPLPPWVKAAAVSIEYDGPAAGSGFVVTTLEADNSPAGDTLAASLDVRYRGVSVFGVDTENAGTPAKILVQDAGRGRWTVRISPVALAPMLEVPGTTGTFWTSVFLYGGEASGWTFTKDETDATGRFTVAQFTTDKARHVLVDKLMSSAFRGTVTALPGPSVVIVDSDGPWRVDP